MSDGFWSEVVKKGRIAQWMITGGGIALCIIGGLNGFLDAPAISSIVLAMVAAVFGIEAIAK